MLFKMLQGIVDALAGLLNVVVAILPKSPFSGRWDSLVLDNDLLSALAWIIPFKAILSLLSAWLVAIGVFYIHMIVLRWIKAIE